MRAEAVDVCMNSCEGGGGGSVTLEPEMWRL